MERKSVLLTTAVSIILVAAVILLGSWLVKAPADSPGDPQQTALIINEVMSRNETYPDSNGQLLDYIELYNPGSTQIDISGYKLSDKPDELGFTFPQGTIIQPNSYLVVYCHPDSNSGEHPNFGLSRDGETLYLYNSANVCVQTLDVPALPDDMPYMRDDNGTWSIGTYGTPGYPNNELGHSAWMDAMNLTPATIVISEVQSANRSGITNMAGQLCDWIELHNPTDSPAVLDGYFLSDNPEKPMKWQITSLTIPAGGYEIICCTDQEDATFEAPFGLSKNGCSLVLTGPVGTLITELTVPALQADTAWQLQADGSYLATEEISPGYPNTDAGFQSYLADRKILGALAISEVMPANDKYLIQNDGEYYDWVELKNISSSPINLSDYAISDDSSDPDLFRLPEQTLQPGEMVIIILSGNTELTGRYIHAPFSLNKQEFWFYVTHLEDGYSDYVHVKDVPLACTAGRKGTDPQVLYFSRPTPEQENADGYAQVTDDPFVQTPGGIYNDISQLSVVLSGDGDIYYTLDGSVPNTASYKYTHPILLYRTTTLRAICYGEDKLPSRVVTTGYILNENHTLPVLSVAVDPDAMFGGGGIYVNYTQNIEIPCNLSLYEGGNSFSVDCGIKMFGHTGLQAAKKSFKINFRSRYGDSLLTYPVYGEDGPEVYDSLIIRSGQDYPYAIFRDELFTSLCRQMGDNVLAQRDKFCILYINGEYRGIYCLKEAFSEFYYASNRGVTEESVDMVQAPVYPSSDIYQFMNYLNNHDITDPEVYEYACTIFNMESLIDWLIIQGYSTNGDVQQNLRYFRSSENGGTYEWAFYDLDWAFYYHLPFTDVLSNGREMNWQHLRYTMKIIQNPTFRKQFLERLSYHMERTLSTENVLARIDYYQQLLAPEVARERERWGGTVSGWEWQVDKLRRFITEWDHMADMVARLQRYIGLTQSEIDQYFGRWA